MRLLAAVVILGLVLAPAVAQVDDRALSGEYRFVLLRYTQFARFPAQPAVKTGTIEFDGAGGLTSGSVSGPYSVRADGGLSLTSPVDGGVLIDAGISPALGPLTGLSPASEASFEWLIGIAAPEADFNSALFSGSYICFAILLSPFDPTASLIVVFGFESGDTTATLGPDGTGTIRFPASSGLGDFVFNSFVSSDGGLLAGTFDDQGVNGLFFAARGIEAFPGGRHWALELEVDRGRVSAGWGALRAGAGRARFSQRWVGPRGAFDYRGSSDFDLTDGVGLLGQTPVAATAGGTLIGGGVGTATGSLFLAHPAPDATSNEFHLAADVDAASFTTAAAAPGQLRSLFGSGLSTGEAAATQLPPPTELNGTSVTINGQLAPLLFVSSTQINYQVPNEAADPVLQVSVSGPRGESNQLVTALKPSSPALFTVDGSGTGSGIVTHADFSLVSAEAPAAPGEVLVSFLTGLGHLIQLPQVMVDGRAAEVFFAGRVEGFVGLDFFGGTYGLVPLA